MSIRFVNRGVKHAILSTTLQDATGVLSGTNVSPANRTGVIGSQLADTTGLLQGLVSGSPNRTGSIASTLDPATGQLIGHSGAPATANRMGANSLRLDYYQAEIPFANVLKGSKGGKVYSSWDTSGADHPADLQLDSDGYPTSLTGISGTVYSEVHTAVFVNINLSPGTANPVPNQTTLYPPGPYRFRFVGQGTITLYGDVTSLSTSTAGVTISGLTITSTQNGQAVITVNLGTPTNGGIGIRITAIPSNVNYPRAMDLVPSSWVSGYDAGDIFNPNFIAIIAAVGWNPWRDMDWACINNRTPQIQFSATPAAGSTGGTINGVFGDGTWPQGAQSWPFPTGTYNAIFSDGITRACGFTAYSAAVTWASLSATQTNASIYPSIAPWSQRTLPSNMTWAGPHGPPEEVLIALCNKLGIDAWHCFGIDTSATEWTAVANMYRDGTGCQGGIATTGLNPALKVFCEFSNEIWNATFPQQKYANYAAQGFFGSTISQQWQGMQCAKIADAWFAVYGSSAFASRVVVSVGGQSATGNGSAFMIDAMNTPAWTGAGNAPASAHHIGAIHYAPYFDESIISAADANTILQTADPTLTLLKLAWTNVVGSTTYGSVPSAGYIGKVVSDHTTIFAAIASQSWASLPRLGYESGDNWKDNTGVAGWQARIFATMRDSRFALIYNDSSKVLDGVHTGYLPAMKAAGFSWLNHYQAFLQMGQGGFCYGAYESEQQTVMPPKALGMHNFIIGA